ncbi:MAG: hypothetical protein QOD53_2538 [Thermoleophilaceae bacterium]|nr:hypothetical protein [Thermoleophilaceae bacterium]
MSKRVLITGAASGIGAATAAELRSRGARVVGLDLNPGHDILACDVRDQEAVNAAVADAVERLGGLDVVINNAGIGTPQSAAAAPDASALAVIDVYMLGPWRVTAAALPALRKSKGRVVNVASGLAHLTIPFATAYCMSKTGVVAYSDALRLEQGGTIEVTTVYPGYIKTPIHDASAEQGIGLDGLVPEEPLSSAAATLTRAALGRYVRDLATTRRGTVSYALARRAPRRVLDRLVGAGMRRASKDGRFDSSPMAREFVERARGR